jgi:Sulfatase
MSARRHPLLTEWQRYQRRVTGWELDGMALQEYEPGAAFPGVIGRTTDESSPAWPKPLRPEAGSANVLFIVLDDTGFGQLGCYGSPIATPNLDALARDGLLYTNMHTTALCSPSRSCIITGRNHHANATASINELATGYPGYNGQIPFENGFLSEMLLAHGTARTWSASTTCCHRSSSPAPGRSTGGR